MFIYVRCYKKCTVYHPPQAEGQSKEGASVQSKSLIFGGKGGQGFNKYEADPFLHSHIILSYFAHAAYVFAKLIA